MNKRIKLKKGILHKRCDYSCNLYKAIYDLSFETNIGCEGCKFVEGEAIENLKKENEWNNGKFKRLSLWQSSQVIEKRKPLGLCWTKEKELYVGIDNLTGDA